MQADPDQYDEKEAQERFEKALRGGLKTSPTPLKDVPRKGEKGSKTLGVQKRSKTRTPSQC
jgi:hypothetical protein